MTKKKHHPVHFLQAMTTIWQREITRYRRDRTRIVSTIVQPVMFLIVFGSGFRRTLASGLGMDFLAFMYPGTIAMTVMGVALFSTVMVLATVIAFNKRS